MGKVGSGKRGQGVIRGQFAGIEGERERERERERNGGRGFSHHVRRGPPTSIGNRLHPNQHVDGVV
jgi:hypothetical protein